jgi:hypothetical protein
MGVNARPLLAHVDRHADPTSAEDLDALTLVHRCSTLIACINDTFCVAATFSSASWEERPRHAWR